MVNGTFLAWAKNNPSLHTKPIKAAKPRERSRDMALGIASVSKPRYLLEYSPFANSVCFVIAKSLDVYALAKLLLEKEKRPFAVVAKEIGMSASEFHAAVQRLAHAGLIEQESRKPRGKPVEEFLFHGVPYAFPATQGAPTRGVPTSHLAAPLKAHLAVSTGTLGPVWPDSNGKARGYAIDPLHPSAPVAAKTDPSFYEMLALIDALRDGRTRERALAREELHRRIFPV